MLQSRNNKKRKFSYFLLAEFCLTEREKAKKKKYLELGNWQSKPYKTADYCYFFDLCD